MGDAIATTLGFFIEANNFLLYLQDQPPWVAIIGITAGIAISLIVTWREGKATIRTSETAAAE